MKDEGREFEEDDENSDGVELDVVSEAEVTEPLLECGRPKLYVGEGGAIGVLLVVVRRN